MGIEPPRRIFAMGGGGFSTEPENPLLDDYLLSLAPSGQTPRVCFVGTASGDTPEYRDLFRAALRRRPLRALGTDALRAYRPRSGRLPG